MKRAFRLLIAWRRWSLLDKGVHAPGPQARLDAALRRNTPPAEQAADPQAMRARVISAILSDSPAPASSRSVGIVIPWSRVALAAAVLALGVSAVVWTLASSRPSGQPVAQAGQPVVPAPESHAEAGSNGTARMLLVPDWARSIPLDPLEVEARRLGEDLRQVAAALRERLPGVSVLAVRSDRGL